MRHARGGRNGRRAGFTLVEVMIAIVVVLLALAGYSHSLVSSMVAADTDEEIRRATEAARTVMEEIQGADLADVFVLYNHTVADDPVGEDAPGAAFGAPGLTPLKNDPDGFVGEVQLPTMTIGGVEQIREDVVNDALGMPRDLNGDGDIDSNDHSGDYVILPVRIRMQWRGPRGRASLEYYTLLSGF